jgi:TENA/THI-4/PQQC family
MFRESVRREFFTVLGQGEVVALSLVLDLAAACDMDEDAVEDYEPQAGCHAYPAYLAWLALNAHPLEALIAITANFAAWGSSCATIASALRRHYGFDDRAWAFVDLFATPYRRSSTRRSPQVRPASTSASAPPGPIAMGSCCRPTS